MNTSFLDACRKKQPEHTPVWFMRQAGRYLPDYRRVKGNMHVTEVARDPELASQVAVDAVNALGVDAGIIFADIMLPLEAMGVDFTIEENVGPIVNKPLKSVDDIRALEDFVPERVGYIFDGIQTTLRKLDDAVPLIGFSGAPFTLAGYLIEGRPSRELEKTKEMMYNKPEAWRLLMEKLTKMACSYLSRQVSAGVDAIQLFDSWVGCLSPDDYRAYVSRYTSEVMTSLSGKVPRIHFCANSSSLIEELLRTGPDVLSVDWRIEIDDAWARCRNGTSIQGNLDPVLAMSGGRPMREKVDQILAESADRDGHIFSLGHGVLRETPPENLRLIVQAVHEKTRVAA